jgi:D-3-phosphoglycerate dehydrogenase / 2-oxoglutarate reductase
MKLVVKTDDVVELGDEELAMLAAVPARLVERPAATEEALVEHARDADAILTLDEPLTAGVIEQLRACRVISRFGIGVDRVDIAAATQRGIVVTNVPDYCVDEVSDHALALLLGIARRTHALDAAVRAGTWETAAVAGEVHRLRGQILGVVGFGRLGRRLSEKTQALGLRVLAHDPYVADEEVRALGAEPVPLDELLQRSDWVSLHLPLTPETRHLIDKAALRRMKSSAVLVNTARGALVDQAALVGALRDGRLAGAALDVLEREPPAPDDPLLELANVVLTSHAAFYSVESLAEMRRSAVENVVRVLAGRPPLFAVNEIPRG